MHTCLSPCIRDCYGKPEFRYNANILGHIKMWWMKATPGYCVAKYDADVLGHTWNVMNEGNARILGY